MGYRNFALGSVAASLIIAAAGYPVSAAAQAAPDLGTLTAHKLRQTSARQDHEHGANHSGDCARQSQHKTQRLHHAG